MRWKRRARRSAAWWTPFSTKKASSACAASTSPLSCATPAPLTARAAWPRISRSRPKPAWKIWWTPITAARCWPCRTSSSNGRAEPRRAMLPFKLIYPDRFDLNLGAHVFASQKYRLVRETLLREKLADASDFVSPEPAADEDVLRVHSQEWVRKLQTGKLSITELMRLEIPYSKETIEAFWAAAGGTLLAGQRALDEGMCVNVGGGFHHAFPDHGEGFCAIHDVAIAIRRLQ